MSRKKESAVPIPDDNDNRHNAPIDNRNDDDDDVSILGRGGGGVAPWLEDNGDDEYRQMFGIDENEGGGADSASNSAFSSNPSQEHSFVNKNDARPNPRRSTRKRRNRADEAAEDMMDENTKEAKFEKTIDFKGQDLRLSNILNGEHIKSTRKEKATLKKIKSDIKERRRRVDNGENPGDVFEDAAQAANGFRNIGLYDDDDDEDGGSQRKKKRRKPNGGEADDDDDDDDSDEGSEENEEKAHILCKLCRHVTSCADADSDVKDAYKLMVELDFRKCGLASDAVIFQEMAQLFNTKQRQKMEEGRNGFFVRVEEVKNHFIHHDNGNPLRHMNEQLRSLREIIREGRKFIFGRAEGKRFWNTPKTKIFLAVLKQEQSAANNFAIMRSQVDRIIREQSRDGGGDENDGKASRHLNGTGKVSRYGAVNMK